MTTTMELAPAVRQLAVTLETPIIPGEMENWLNLVRGALAEVAALLRRDIETVHKSDFAEIGRTDPELLRQVGLLREEDTRSLQMLEALENTCARLLPRLCRVEPHEALLDQELKKVMDEGLALVIQVEKQEVARRTWLQEAWNRDRGVAD